MTKLSININKIATLRNSRGGNVPDLLQVARDCESFGAEGITVHPRPDERHIRYKDVIDLAGQLTTEFNIEGYPSTKFMDLVKAVKPTQVTLVPDAPDALTSNAGWNTVDYKSFLSEIVDDLKSVGIRTSIFVDANKKMVEHAAETGTDRIELYTEPYAINYANGRNQAISPFVESAKFAKKIGLGINAGHDLSLENLKFFSESIPWLDEVSIGHALISHALYIGLQKTIEAYKDCLKKR